jgi:O-acetylhomoserine/O-acetylserine sulfhydrylase-like pyridoxal-dependent enzyme
MTLPDEAIFTLAVHAGERAARPDFTPVGTPIHHSITYLYDEMAAVDAVFDGRKAGYVYARYGSPTISALERALATLEGGEVKGVALNLTHSPENQ